MRRRWLRTSALFVAALVGAGTGGGSGHTARTTPPRVTLIGDSVPTALLGDAPARAILSRGIDLRLEVSPCRRIEQPSCPYNGAHAPTVVELAQSEGSKLGSTVMVVVGYNDFTDTFPQDLEDALRALKQAGVKNVLWATLREVWSSYLVVNDELVTAAAHHPELTVVDWNLYSRNHPDWFQQDGIHLNWAGARAMATLLHVRLVNLGIPAGSRLPPARGPVRIATNRLPVAARGKFYSVTLRASGGRAPYFWSSPRRLPRGLHVRTPGLISGFPRARPGRFVVRVHVRDSGRRSAAKSLVLRIRR